MDWCLKFPICEGCESVERKVARGGRSADKVVSERVDVENGRGDCTSIFLITPEAKMSGEKKGGGDHAQVEPTVCPSLLMG